ncbi:retrovirus-related pol polyprotein from transposon TNT 1-94 [Tanacetum coccineum]
MLIYAKAPLFLWAEAVATACYTQNRSIIRLHHGKTPYELLHDKLPDLSFFYVFGAHCYLTNDSENLGKLQPKADIDFDELTAMASEHSSLEPALHEMTPATISSGLVPNPPPSTPFVPPSRTDWDLSFVSNHCLKNYSPSLSSDTPAPKVIAPIVEAVAPNPLLQSVYLPQQLLTKMHHLLESVAPEASLDAIRIFSHLLLTMNMIVYQMDVKTTFLNDIMYEEVYISQPDEFVDQDNLNHVYKLKKALYGLKQAPQQRWILSIALTDYADSEIMRIPIILERRTIIERMQLLGDRLVSSSKRQKSAAIFSTEAEYIALSVCCAQVL